MAFPGHVAAWWPRRCSRTRACWARAKPGATRALGVVLPRHLEPEADSPAARGVQNHWVPVWLPLGQGDRGHTRLIGFQVVHFV